MQELSRCRTVTHGRNKDTWKIYLKCRSPGPAHINSASQDLGSGSGLHLLVMPQAIWMSVVRRASFENYCKCCYHSFLSCNIYPPTPILQFYILTGYPFHIYLLTSMFFSLVKLRRSEFKSQIFS